VEPSRLAEIPLFAALGNRQLAEIAAVAAEAEAGEGETIATQGELGHALFAIESGTVEVSADGDLVATLGAGDVFGEIAVIAAGVRMASVVATSPVRLIGLSKRDVLALERRSPQTYAHLLDLMNKRTADLGKR
jgi:CRP/FNR family transcriptional regulator, cyclic AMP receptor protein